MSKGLSVSKRKRMEVATCSVCGEIYKGKYAGNSVSGCISAHKRGLKPPFIGTPANIQTIPFNVPANIQNVPYNVTPNVPMLATDTKDNPSGDWVDWLDGGKGATAKDGAVVINNYPSQQVMPYTPQPIAMRALSGAVDLQPNVKAMKWIAIAVIGIIALAILADSGALTNGKGGEGSGLGILSMAGMALGMSKKIRTELKGWDVI